MSYLIRNGGRKSGEVIFLVVCSALLVALVLMTFGDVVGRKFDHPFHVGYELTQLLMAGLVFLAMTYVTVVQKHITVDIMSLPDASGVKRLWAACLALMMGTSLFFFTFTLWQEGNSLVAMNNLMMMTRVPVGYVAYFGACCTGIAAAICLIQFCKGLYTLRTG